MEAKDRKKILFVASECVPFIKTGGLADVVGSLPKDIDPEYYDVRVMIPKYSCMKQDVKDQMEYVTHFYMDYHWKSEYVGVLKTVKNGITFYFIDNEGFFTTDKVYTDDPIFEITRFAFFSKACLSALPAIDFRPDLIHCHDWQTGLVPVYLKERFQANEFFHGIKTVMTIHNLKFQGKWNVKDVEDITGLSGYYFTPDKLEAYKDANLLKIATLKKRFPDLYIGYSDHTKPTPECDVIKTAYNLGAQLVEKHYTLDKTLKGNDHYHAMDPEDAKNILKIVGK